MADTPNSLLSRAWGAVISLLGIAVTLAFIVSIIQSIWLWLAAIAVIVIVMAVGVLLIRRWWERRRW
ncbi:hypothetical protein BHE97_14545 [Aeromicrobium sp. PE09-221]|uniref:hypothetical protein n=1 Tax=Aeromicrobium sp. PE09-221 TaxID=1898043 RepID=UPI000B3E4522|nr:hypothetical protein [Aeromicrobium sp. PE09-221]OUZ08149.1 hypothetical protein BHE97_14545 [Aeromicrobium sp. PE09-221]